MKSVMLRDVQDQVAAMLGASGAPSHAFVQVCSPHLLSLTKSDS